SAINPRYFIGFAAMISAAIRFWSSHCARARFTDTPAAFTLPCLAEAPCAPYRRRGPVLFDAPCNSVSRCRVRDSRAEILAPRPALSLVQTCRHPGDSLWGGRGPNVRGVPGFQAI